MKTSPACLILLRNGYSKDITWGARPIFADCRKFGPKYQPVQKHIYTLSEVVAFNAPAGSSPAFKSLLQREEPPETAQQKPEGSE